jgi:peptide/nickel transport system permease protein
MATQPSTLAPAPSALVDALLLHKPRTLWGDAFRQFRRHRLAMVGLCVLIVLTLGVAFGPIIWPKPINDIDFTHRLVGPSLAHPMGTDELGQDLLARILYGGRVTLSVGLAAMLIAVTLGTAIGSIAGYFGGWADQILMRFTDLLIALPQLPLLLMIIYLFRDKLRHSVGVETGTFILIVSIIGFLRWMPVARLVRAQFLSIKEKEYMEAARCIGVPGLRTIFVQMLPNALSPVIVAGSLAVAAAIITESTLSFLGLGFPPDHPTWGRLLFDAKDQLELGAHATLFPGLMIFLTVLSVNFVGDGLRDALDPRRAN